jgi:hypothetical protein
MGYVALGLSSALRSAASEPRPSIPSHPEYERSFIEGRADAVYGWLILEYERPGKLT